MSEAHPGGEVGTSLAPPPSPCHRSDPGEPPPPVLLWPPTSCPQSLRSPRAPRPWVALRAAPHLLGSPSSARSSWLWGCQSLPPCRHQQPPRTPLCWQPHPWAFLPPAGQNLLLSSVLGADPHPGPLLSPFPCSAQLLGLPRRVRGCPVSLRGFTPHFFWKYPGHGASSPCRRGVPHKPGGGGRQSCGDLGRSGCV